MALLAYLASAWPMEASAREKRVCGEPWGDVAMEGFVVAADVPRTSSAALCIGKAIRRVQPGYPVSAKIDHATGTIVILARVSETGCMQRLIADTENA
jgi:hypothetical protein